MPGTDATNSSETSMSLSWESSDTESLDNTSITFTSGYTKNIAHFSFSKDLINSHVLLEFSSDECNFVSGGTSINLDFHEVSSFLFDSVEFGWLGVSHLSLRYRFY